MDHGRLNFEYRQNNEGKIVIRGNHHILTGHARKLVGNSVEGTACIYRLRHQRWLPDTGRACGGTNRYIEVVILGLGIYIVIRQGTVDWIFRMCCMPGIIIILGYAIVKTNDDAARFIFNGRNTSGLNLFQFTFAVTKRTVTIQIFAVSFIELTRNGITHAEACGVFYNKPGIEQAPKFQGADQYQQ